jgi:hypothetical protein
MRPSLCVPECTSTVDECSVAGILWTRFGFVGRCGPSSPRQHPGDGPRSKLHQTFSRFEALFLSTVEATALASSSVADPAALLNIVAQSARTFARDAQRTNQPIDCVAAASEASWRNGTNGEDHGLGRHQLASRNPAMGKRDSGRSLWSGLDVSHLRTIAITPSSAPSPPTAIVRSPSSAVPPP